MRLVAVAAVLAISAAIPPAPADAARGRVTRAEFRQIEDGMARAEAERIMSAGRGHCTYRIDYGNVVLMTRQYRQNRGGWAAITYEIRDGRPVPRVEDKERNTTLTTGTGCR